LAVSHSYGLFALRSINICTGESLFGSASPSPACRSFGFSVRPLTSDEARFLANLKYLLRIEQSEKLDQLRHQSRPSRLVTRAESGAIVPVEVFIK
jgi:hypothetical protein